MNNIVEKNKVFVLNEEQKILVFLTIDRIVPKLFIPNLYLEEIQKKIIFF